VSLRVADLAPEFDAPSTARRWCTVAPALRMRSRVNQWHTEQPGLVFALLARGACRHGLPAAHEQAESELERLWAREMPTGVYDASPAALPHAAGTVAALAFTLNRRSEACLARLPDEEVLHILRQRPRPLRSTLEYLPRPRPPCARMACADREIERLMALSRRHGLV